MSKIKEFLKIGSPTTLFSAFLYFDISFMIWVMIGALGIFITDEFGLTPAQKGMLVSIPLLGGALLRIPMGILSDKFGSRRVALTGMVATMIPLTIGWLFAGSMTEVYVMAILLGVAGASFAVALPLASKWYPPQYQGLVMGIAGAGNSGTVFATFFAPRIAKIYGWHSVFGLALIPLAIAFIVFFFLAKDSTLVKTQPKTITDFLKPLRSRDALLFSLLYSITFGGFVGLASFLPIFFHDQFTLDKITAGNATALCVLAGSFVRPVGGYLADKFGGVKVLTILFLIIGALAFVISGMHSLTVTLISFVALMLCLGSGNGSVFQLVPVRFKNEVGVITGFVGAFGGLGGFFLPNILGSIKSLTGSYSYGYIVFGVTAILASASLFYINYVVWVKENWNTTEEAAVA
jgi:NNP family nitrate/nitrite transporter-like MFS transporter